MANDQVYDITFRGADELSPVAGTAASAMKRLDAELEGAQKRIFDRSHSAREVELRDAQDHYSKLEGSLKAYLGRLDEAERAAHERLRALRVERAGRRAGPEIAAVKREMEEIAAARAKAQETLLANEADFQSKQESLTKHWYQRRVDFLRSPHALKAMLGGFIAAEGLHAALGLEKAHYAQQEYETVAGNRNAKLEDVVAARMAVVEARGGVLRGIPIVGDIARTFSDLGANRPLLEKLAQSAAQASTKVDALGQATARAAQNIEQGLAHLYHYLPGEAAQKQFEQQQTAQMGALYQGREAMMSANTALGMASVTGVGMAQAQRLVDQATTRYIALLDLQKQQEAVGRANVEEAMEAEERRFALENQTGMAAAGRMGVYQTPDVRHQAEREALSARQQREMERFATLDRRIADWRSGKDTSDWVQRRAAELMAADPGKYPMKDIALKQAQSEAPRHSLETQHALEIEKSERQRTLDLHRAQTAGQTAQEGLEARGVQEQADIIGMGGSVLQSVQREKQRREITFAGRTEDQKLVNARLKALDEQHDVEDWERGRKHDRAMKDAAAAAALDRETVRKREMDRIAEGYEDDLYKFADNEKEKRRIQDEIAAKQKALGVQQAEERQREGVGVVQDSLKTAGGAFADLAERLGVQERFRQLRQQYGKDKGMTDLLNLTERAQMSELVARQNWLPHEVAAIGGVGYRGGRPAGFDSPMAGMTAATHQLRTALERNSGLLEQIAGKLGLNISSLDSFGN